MKKVIFGLAMLLAASTAVPALATSNAQTPVNSTENVGESNTQQQRKERKDRKRRDGRRQECQTNDSTSAFNGKAAKDGARYAKAGARKGGKQRMGGKRQKQDLFAGITLTDAQKQQIKDLRAKSREERQEISADVKKAQEKTREKVAEAKKEAREKYDKALSKILTPEQYAKYQQNVSNAAARKAEMKSASQKNGMNKKGGRRQMQSSASNAASTVNAQ